MGCCKNIIGSLVCIAILCGAGIAAYMYGPWNKDKDSDGSDETPTTLTAKSSSCENCCNGLESNCDLPINEVTWAFVHNAMSDDSFYAANNDLPLERALVEGYRGLMLDSCLCDGDNIVDLIQDYVTGNDEDSEEKNPEEQYVGFCHGTCAAGSRSPAIVLKNIKTFLDVNPKEVLILEFEVGEGTLELLYQAINDSGLEKYVLRGLKNDGTVTSWPTFQQLINSNRRLLLFAHDGGMGSCEKQTCPEGIFYTFDHFSQTNWNDDTCDLRGNDNTDVLDNRGFFMMNHWLNDDDLDLPSKTNAEQFNTYEFLSARFDKCDLRMPNVIAVDFWSTGDVLKFVEDQNTKLGGGGEDAVASSRSGSIRH